MKKIFIDTNILIDYLAERSPFYNSAAIIVSLAKNKKIRLLVSPLSFATANYILGKYYHDKDIIDMFRTFTKWCSITTMDPYTTTAAIENPFKDFEDALQYQSAIRSGSDIIVTRNKKDFTESKIPVMEPEECLNFLISK